jgi:UTP---glucose-1-phosphate uridylyltransferase
VVFNERRKVTSSCKRQPNDSGNLRQTPQGSFLDLMKNNIAIMRDHDHGWTVEAGEISETSEIPSHILLFHPSMGPLWEVMRQKLGTGLLAPGAEMVLDCPEVRIDDLVVDGSFRVLVKEPETEQYTTRPQRVFMHHQTPRCRLEKCTIVNDGIDFDNPGNQYWRCRVVRRESLTIELEGDAEFDAQGCVFRGNYTFRVPAGYRMTVRPNPDAMDDAKESLIAVDLTAKREGSWSWRWVYHLSEEGEVKLALRESD